MGGGAGAAARAGVGPSNLCTLAVSPGRMAFPAPKEERRAATPFFTSLPPAFPVTRPRPDANYCTPFYTHHLYSQGCQLFLSGQQGCIGCSTAALNDRHRGFNPFPTLVVGHQPFQSPPAASILRGWASSSNKACSHLLPHLLNQFSTPHWDFLLPCLLCLSPPPPLPSLFRYSGMDLGGIEDLRQLPQVSH